jgi:hypothetical protein
MPVILALKRLRQRGLQVQGQPGLHSELLSQKKKIQNNPNKTKVSKEQRSGASSGVIYQWPNPGIDTKLNCCLHVSLRIVLYLYVSVSVL